MFGAFSFGKIIKTLLPGAILGLGVLLLVEAVGLKCQDRSILWWLTEEKRLTAVTAAMVPLTLLLGFWLNTALWMTVNRGLRERVRATVDSEGYGPLREALLLRRNDGLGRLLGKKLPEPIPTRSLEYYFLPRITLERLGYVWESYFSWFEFQMNSAYSLLFSAAPASYYLLVRFPGTTGIVWASLVVLGGLLAAGALIAAAYENRCQYERSLLVLIAGALESGVPAQPTQAAGT